jgi:hypothetical protein
VPGGIVQFIGVQRRTGFLRTLPLLIARQGGSRLLRVGGMPVAVTVDSYSYGS